MRIHLVKEKSIRDYVLRNAGSQLPFQAWLSKLKRADWEKPSDMLCTYNSADLLGKGCARVVFNIGGNNYRMICQFAFGKKEVQVFACWIGTHAAYDIVCRDKKQYSINVY